MRVRVRVSVLVGLCVFIASASYTAEVVPERLRTSALLGRKYGSATGIGATACTRKLQPGTWGGFSLAFGAMWHERTRSCGRWVVCTRRGLTESREAAPPLGELKAPAGLSPGACVDAATCRGARLVRVHEASFNASATAPPQNKYALEVVPGGASPLGGLQRWQARGSYC